jgi:hypothetical protein
LPGEILIAGQFYNPLPTFPAHGTKEIEVIVRYYERQALLPDQMAELNSRLICLRGSATMAVGECMADLLSQDDLNDLFAELSLDCPGGDGLESAEPVVEKSSAEDEILDQDDIDNLLASYGRG